MGEIILEKQNKLVKKGDLFIKLGDYVVGAPKKLERYKYWRDRTICQNIWYCRGNHSPHSYVDPYTDRLMLDKLGEIFNEVFDYKVVKLAGKWITLNHFFMGTFYEHNHGGIALGGHSHGNLQVPPGIRWKDCGVDCNVKDPWAPFNLEEIISEMGEIDRIKIDHH